MSTIFITGGTGYLGSRLVQQLLNRGHQVTALVRQGSEGKLPPLVRRVVADPFTPQSFQTSIPPGAVFVQLLGVAHPSPRKALQFRQVDLRSVKASADAAATAGVSQFIYVSVNMVPSRIMQAFQQVRGEGEAYCLAKGLPCTFLRPWYVLGPGHWWPLLLLPAYALAQLVPAWRQQVQSRSLVTIQQMIRSLVGAVEATPQSLRILDIPQIRSAAIK